MPSGGHTFARKLRRGQTEAEQRLWSRLRAHQLEGLKFRRQEPIGPYIVDFVCLERSLIIEVDGGQHAENADQDAERSAWLRAEGFEVIRFWNHDVLRETDAVVEAIRDALSRGPMT